MSKGISRLYEFGKYRLDVESRVLFRDEQAVALPPKAVELLAVLVEQSGEVVSKKQLMGQLWPDAFVEDANLTQNIFLLRKVFGEDGSGQKLIETIPRRGYRFVADVRPVPPTNGHKQIASLPGEQLLEQLHLAPQVAAESAEPRASEPTISPLSEAQPAPSLPADGRQILTSRARAILAGGVFILALAAMSYFFIFRKSPQVATTATTRAIAVLPFRSIHAEGQNEYLELGMADALITRLSNVSQIIVRPTSAVRKYAGTDQDAIAIGRTLGVESVLEGSIQRVGERLRVTVQLVSVRDGAPLWAANFDEQFTDVFAVEDSISAQLAQALKLKLTDEEQLRLIKRYTENVDAYQLYLKGRYFWNKRTEQGFAQAVEFFKQAIEKDPGYALAYAGLADCYALLSVWSARPPNEALVKARAAALQATTLDQSLAEAHTSLAFAKWIYDRDWPGAEAEFRQAISLNPRYPTAHQWYAYLLAGMKRFDEAIAQIKQARDLDELSPSINTDVGEIYCWARQTDLAIAQLQEVLTREPNFAPAHNILGMTYIKMERLRDGVEELETARRLDNSPRIMSALGCAYGLSGQRDRAQQILSELQTLSKQRYISPFSRALIYASLGQKDEAFAGLEKAFDEHSDTIVIMKVYPWLDNLRSDPRFINLLRRVGLEP